ncbi:MAG: hypothetical protein Q9163_004431 [Psora crenata]
MMTTTSSIKTATTTTNYNNNPRRRLMAIQNMLNPSDSDVRTSTSPSIGSDSGLDDDGRSLRLSAVSGDLTPSPSFQGGSGRGRLTSSSSLSGSGSSNSSRSSSSPDIQARSRSFRPAYNLEMADFIWFLKVDRNRPWDEILTDFNRQFSEDHREKSGLQCKYYRHIKRYGVTRTRAQGRAAGFPNRYGMLTNTGRRYPWMDRYA